MDKSDLNLLIGGEAGQGLVTIGNLLAKSLVRSGYSIVVNQSYQSRIRGGHNFFAIRVSTEEITANREEVDLLVALDIDSVALHEKELRADALVIADTTCPVGNFQCIPVPYGQLGEKKFNNVVALGVVSLILGLDKELVLRILNDVFGKKDSQVVERNREVLEAAISWCDQQEINFPKLTPIAKPLQRMFMNGNEAIALGAISAGVKFCSFYPMTPSTSIALRMAAEARRIGLVVEQAEDEIAAINMAIGASFAGVPSIVSTSGGGFSLMVESISLAAMTETPIVVVVAQRPGPATGLPTRTEQADLDFVLHAGHGEFPRAIFSPGTVEDCFWLTRKAFEVAAKYQGPTFLLTDQFLADSYRAVLPFDLEGLTTVDSKIETNAPSTPYKRYAITENGVSPRLVPGMTKHLIIADSDEHAEDGHITEDHTVRKLMVEKRLRKQEGIIDSVTSPELLGDENPDLLMVTWGSSKGAVLDAGNQLRTKNIRVAILHFSQVWPLVSEQFIGPLLNAGEVICVESNALGQLARLIRRETGFTVQRKILRYDGLPLTPEYILRELKR